MQIAGAVRGGVLLVGLVLVLASPAIAGGKKAPASAKEQLEFGVDMARRELWSEALFRFNQARTLDPENPAILNNLAVAHEALGLFEEALELYRQALKLNASDRNVKRNYARFVEFYQSFKPPPAEEDKAETPVENAHGGARDAPV